MKTVNSQIMRVKSVKTKVTKLKFYGFMIWMIRYYDLADLAKTAARKLVVKFMKFLVSVLNGIDVSKNIHFPYF